MVTQRKVTVRHNKHMYIAVQPAIEGEVGLLRVHCAVGAVVHRNGQRVLRGQRGGQVDPKSRVPARMTRQLLSVQGYDGRHGGALKFQPDLLAVGVFGGGKFLCIEAGTAEVIVAAVGAVSGVPCVRQGHVLRVCAGLGKLPAGMKQVGSAHIGTLLFCTVSGLLLIV